MMISNPCAVRDDRVKSPPFYCHFEHYVLCQGPWNLYGRDGRFNLTFDDLMSAYDLPKSKLNSELFKMCTFIPRCTTLHRFAPIFSKKISRVNTPDPTTRRARQGPHSPTPWCTSTVPLFKSFRGCWFMR